MSECEDCGQLDYAAIVGDAMRFERERIIKLLLNERWDAPEIATPYVRHAIALIEGENK